MKNLIFIMAATAVIFNFQPALADNPEIEEAIRSRPELSSFYQALINTGVNHELEPGRTYTVFAPTNEAFAKISPQEYPCFYSATCRSEVAQVVRNHIVPGEVHLSDASRNKGGLYSVDNRFVTIGKDHRNDFQLADNSYTVDGSNVISANSLGTSMLYKIDGVIASDRELSSFQPYYAYFPEQTTTVTRTTRQVPVAQAR